MSAERRGNTVKKTRTWILLIVLLLLICVAAAAAVRFFGRGGTTARILLDGVLIRTIDLTAVEEPYSFEVTGKRCTNRIEVERGRIRVKEADCPDQVCVRQSWIANSATPIVCLPNGLVIEIVGTEDGPDAVVQ